MTGADDGEVWDPEAGIEDAIDRLRVAAERACVRYPAYTSAHEAYGLLVEEVAEFFDEVRKPSHRRSELRLHDEARDVAVVALRTMILFRGRGLGGEADEV